MLSNASNFNFFLISAKQTVKIKAERYFPEKNFLDAFYIKFATCGDLEKVQVFFRKNSFVYPKKKQFLMFTEI